MVPVVEVEEVVGLILLKAGVIEKTMWPTSLGRLPFVANLVSSHSRRRIQFVPKVIICNISPPFFELSRIGIGCIWKQMYLLGH